MQEIPEALSMSRLVEEHLVGKQIRDAVAGCSPHKFVWYSADPSTYGTRLRGRKIVRGEAHGGYLCIAFDDGNELRLGEGCRTLLLSPERKEPEKHQLLAEFEDGDRLAVIVLGYGFVSLESSENSGNNYFAASKSKPSPLSDAFDRAYFDALLAPIKQGPFSIKAALATEQRIPGFGNGVLQDVLFNAHLHPRRKLAQMGREEYDRLFESLKTTLKAMADQGGRNTEVDLLGRIGGYLTLMSRATVGRPCPACGAIVVKENYMGGSVYTCPKCQQP